MNVYSFFKENFMEKIVHDSRIEVLLNICILIGYMITDEIIFLVYLSFDYFIRLYIFNQYSFIYKLGKYFGKYYPEKYTIAYALKINFSRHIYLTMLFIILLTKLYGYITLSYVILIILFFLKMMQFVQYKCLVCKLYEYINKKIEIISL